jgi:hypothetical protein
VDVRILSIALTVLLLVGCGSAQPTEAPSPTLPIDSLPPAASPTDGAPSPAPPTVPPATAGPSPTAAARPTPDFGPTPGPDGWVGPYFVSDRPYYDVALVVDSAGFAHAAAGLNDAIFYLTNTSGSWTRERISSPPGSGSNQRTDVEPAIAIDGDGSLAISFHRLGPEETFGRFPTGIFLATRGTGGWSAAAAPGNMDEIFLANSTSIQLRDGVAHLVYVEGIPFDVVDEDSVFPLHYRTNAGGSWSDVTVSPVGGKSVLRLDAAGRPHVLFSEFAALLPGDGLRYARSTGGAAFELEIVPGTTSYDYLLGLGLDGSGRPQAVWSPEEGPGVLHAVRDGSAWAAAQQAMSAAGTDGGAVVDGGGAVHIVVAAGNDGVWYATNRGGSFAARQLSTARGLWADVAVDAAGRPHVVFVIRQSGARQLWYGVGPSD